MPDSPLKNSQAAVVRADKNVGTSIFGESPMYKKSLRGRLVRVLAVVLIAGAVAALILYRARVRRFLLYLDARISQEAAAQTGTLPMLNDPRIVISKAERRLYLCDGEIIARTNPVSLGFSPTGHKTREGDGRTPEGKYYICTKNPESRFHRSLGISYPNGEDAARALEAGSITKEQYESIAAAIKAGAAPPWDTPLGGEIYLHGHGASRDWTAGCIALDDAAIEEIYRLVPIATPVEIMP